MSDLSILTDKEFIEFFVRESTKRPKVILYGIAFLDTDEKVEPICFCDQGSDLSPRDWPATLRSLATTLEIWIERAGFQRKTIRKEN